MSSLLSRLHAAPELLLFASLALGAALGRIQLASVQLGGAVGSLLAALLLAQLDVPGAPGFEATFLPLCTYAVGFEAAPRLRRAGRSSARRALRLVLFMVACTLALVLLTARLFGLDRGVSAGMAAGAITSPALAATAADFLIRSAGDALLPSLAVAFAAAYLGGRVVRDALLRWVVSSGRGEAALEDERPRLPTLVGRAYVVELAAGRTIAAVESAGDRSAAIEVIDREGERLQRAPELILRAGDRVIVAGHRGGVMQLGQQLGREDPDARDPGKPVVHARVLLTEPSLHRRSLAELRQLVTNEGRHAIALAGVERTGRTLHVRDTLRLERGDVLELYGLERELSAVVERIGRPLHGDPPTDLVALGLGLSLGIALGSYAERTLGAPWSPACGALVTGIAAGWLHARYVLLASLPPASSFLLKELGLAGSLAALGLRVGAHAKWSLSSWTTQVVLLTLALSAALVLCSTLFGRHALGFHDSRGLARALLAALRGPGEPRARTPLLDGAPSITSAVAGVAFTLLGPLLVWLL
jgi:putative transport protein